MCCESKQNCTVRVNRICVHYILYLIISFKIRSCSTELYQSFLFTFFLIISAGATTQQETWSALTPLPLSPPPPSLHPAILSSRVSADGQALSATLPPRPHPTAHRRLYSLILHRMLPPQPSPNWSDTTLSALTLHTRASKECVCVCIFTHKFSDAGKLVLDQIARLLREYSLLSSFFLCW